MGFFFLGTQGVLRAEDCGVRGYDGNKIVKLDCEVTADPSIPPTSMLRVAIPGPLGGVAIHGLILVDPILSSGVPNPIASNFRVSYTSSSTVVIKAISFIPSVIATCEDLQMVGFHPAYPLTENYTLPSGGLDCSATDPSKWGTSQYAGKLWELGYDGRYGSNGKDGVPREGDDKGSAVETALSSANLGVQGFRPIGKEVSYSGTSSGGLVGIGSSITLKNSYSSVSVTGGERWRSCR